MMVAYYFQQQVLILFFVDAVLQYFMVGNEFKILTDGGFEQPCEWIVPVEHAKQFGPDDIDRVPLPDMDEFMTDDLFQFNFCMKIPVDIDGISKRKRDDSIVYLEYPGILIRDKPCFFDHPVERKELHHQAEKNDGCTNNK